MADTHARVVFLDAARGLAVCGIPFINAAYFHPGTAAPAAATGDVLQILFAGKFVALFSFLFGAGLCLFVERAVAGNRPYVWPYLRRAALLLGLGLVHSVVWPSDIIVSYAGVAVVLLPLCAASRRVMGRVVAAVLLAALCVPLLPAGSPLLVPTGLCFRLLPFVTGMYVARAGGFAPHGRFLPALARRMPVLAALLVGMITGYVALVLVNTTPGGLAAYLRYTGYPMAFCYLAILARLATLAQAQRLMAALAMMGRMSLTHYLTQDSIGRLLVVGLGVLPFGPPGVALLAVLVIVVQLAGSRCWLHRFRQGPAEALLRWLTWARIG